MKEIFKLSPIEKIAQKTLRMLVLLLAIIWIKVIYNQEYKIDQNFILIPCMYLIGIAILMIYTINSFTSGNMVRSWIMGNNRFSGTVFHSMLMFIKRNNKITPDNAIIFTTRIYGSFSMCITFILLYKLVNFFIMKK